VAAPADAVVVTRRFMNSPLPCRCTRSAYARGPGVRPVRKASRGRARSGPEHALGGVDVQGRSAADPRRGWPLLLPVTRSADWAGAVVAAVRLRGSSTWR